MRSSGTQNTNSDDRWLRPLFIAAAILLTLLIFSGVSLWVWPVSSSQMTAWVLGWLSHRPFQPDQVRDLGAQLLGGAVVAAAVLLVETLVEIRFKRTERLRVEQDEERNFRLQMGLQKDLVGIDLTGRVLRSYFLRAKNLSEAGLKNTDLTGSDLTRATLVNVNLAGATLTATAFINARMHGALALKAVANAVRMKGVQLSDAILDAANFQGGEMEEADLRRTSLRDTIFCKTNLTRAKLLEAEIVNTNFEDANLCGADCGGAVFAGAKLAGANLENVRLQKVQYDEATEWPDGFDPAKKGARLVGPQELEGSIAEVQKRRLKWCVDNDGNPQRQT